MYFNAGRPLAGFGSSQLSGCLKGASGDMAGTANGHINKKLVTSSAVALNFKIISIPIVGFIARGFQFSKLTQNLRFRCSNFLR